MDNSTIENLHYLTATSVTTGISGTLSVLSSILLIYTFWDMNKSPTIYMLKLLSLSNLFYAAAFVMGTIRYIVHSLWNDVVYCKTQAFILTWFGIASFLWTAFIAFHVTMIQVKKINLMEKRTTKLVCNIIAWIVPLIAIERNALGERKTIYSHTWCWVNDSQPATSQIIWILLAGKGWEALAYLATCVIYFVGLFILYRRRHSSNRILQRQMGVGERLRLVQTADVDCDNFASKHNTMTWTILYLYFPRMWGTIRYGIEIARLATGNDYPDFHEVDVYFFYFLHNLGDSGQAIINFTMFCLCDKDVRNHMINKMLNNSFFTWCCCCYLNRTSIRRIATDVNDRNETIL